MPHGMNYDKRNVTLCRMSSDMIVFIFVDNRKLLNAQLPGKSVVSMQKLVHSYNQIKKETTIDSFSSCAWHLCYVTCPQWLSCWKAVMTVTWPYLATLLWRWKMSHVRTQTFQLLLTARKFSWFFFFSVITYVAIFSFYIKRNYWYYFTNILFICWYEFLFLEFHVLYCICIFKTFFLLLPVLFPNYWSYAEQNCRENNVLGVRSNNKMGRW